MCVSKQNSALHTVAYGAAKSLYVGKAGLVANKTSNPGLGAMERGHIDKQVCGHRYPGKLMIPGFNVGRRQASRQCCADVHGLGNCDKRVEACCEHRVFLLRVVHESRSNRRQATSETNPYESKPRCKARDQNQGADGNKHG